MKTQSILVLVFYLFGGCSENKPVSPNQKEGYHLNILYGDIENYTGNDGQWLNIYQASSENPTPVYIWAHGNGHTFMDAHEKYEPFVTALIENGISVISWESIKQMDESNYNQILDDAELMYKWVKQNAATYNLDIGKIIIGGHSRGTIASWKLAHSGESGIKGIYCADAAGNLDDVNEAIGNQVSANSPPILMSYTQNKTINDGQHDPNEGQKIIDIYRDFGFTEKEARLILNQGYPSMTELGFYTYLLPFCLIVLE